MGRARISALVNISADSEFHGAPGTDLARVRQFREMQVPLEMRDRVRVEHRVHRASARCGIRRWTRSGPTLRVG